MQLASYLERGPLMWMMPLHLHVNQKYDYDMMMMMMMFSLFLMHPAFSLVGDRQEAKLSSLLAKSST